MCALIYQYKEIIIEDNNYLYATITNYLTIAMNKSLLKQGHRDTKNHGEMIDCITHHVCQEIQGVDGDGADGVNEEVDGEVQPAEVMAMECLPKGERRRRWRWRRRPSVRRPEGGGGAGSPWGLRPLPLLLSC